MYDGKLFAALKLAETCEGRQADRYDFGVELPGSREEGSFEEVI